LPEASPEQATSLTAPEDESTGEAEVTDVSDPEETVAASDGEASPQSLASQSEPEAVPGADSVAEPVTDEPDVLMQVTASILNVREAPSTESDVIIKLGEGARVWMEPEGSQGAWNRIRVEGRVGYASSRFMEPVN